jgi:hypothetical protein
MDQNAELREILTKAYKNGDFVFVPFGKLPTINGLFIPVFTEVKPKITDFYATSGKFGQHHFALMILADAAGVHWSSENGSVGRVDNRSNPNYGSFRVVAQIRTPEGLWSNHASHKHLDIDAKRDAIEIKHAESFDYKEKFGGGKGPNGYDVKKPWPKTKKEYVEKFTSRDVNQLRDNLDERIESGAQVRVIKNILHLPTAWPAKDKDTPVCMGKSFFIVKYILDPQNPKVQAAQLASFHQAITGIYGVPVPIAAPPTEAIEAPKFGKPKDITPEQETETEGFETLSFGEKLNAIEKLVDDSGYTFYKDDILKNGELKDWSDKHLIDYYLFLQKQQEGDNA